MWKKLSLVLQKSGKRSSGIEPMEIGVGLMPTGLSQTFLIFLPTFPREIKLRNYDPEDEELKKRKLPPAKPASVEDTVKEQLEAAKPEPIIDEVDLANLAPRKPDWDLKRDVSKKLEKLEKRTQRAIAELIRSPTSHGSSWAPSAVDGAGRNKTSQRRLEIVNVTKNSKSVP
uniref:Coiled-coil domain containing 12 n=1 Tax=Zonotrichia albicollis TaxID=44394 RepID=A0A8D2MVV1_ZONAL